MLHFSISSRHTQTRGDTKSTLDTNLTSGLRFYLFSIKRGSAVRFWTARSRWEQKRLRTGGELGAEESTSCYLELLKEKEKRFAV